MYVNKVTLIRPLVKPGKSEFPVKTLHLLVQVVLKKRLQAFISHDLRKEKYCLGILTACLYLTHTLGLIWSTDLKRNLKDTKRLRG